MRRSIVLFVAVVGCGRFGFDAQLDPTGDGGLGGDAGVPAVQVAASKNSTCARRGDRLTCWGRAEFGRFGQRNTNIGDGPGDMGDDLPAVDVGGSAIDVGVGENHTCALLSSGIVRCWGSAYFAELGTGELLDRGDRPGDMGNALSEVDLGPSVSVTALHTYENHNCAVLGTGQIKCWGRNSYGMLGQGDTENRGDDSGEMGAALLPVDLGTGRTVAALSVGDHFNCALLDNTAVKCWGRNNYGQLGQEHTRSLGDQANEMGGDLPGIDLSNSAKASALVSGKYHTCVLLDDDTVKCWGYNQHGQLGQGHTDHLGDDSGEMGDNLPVVDFGTGRYALALDAGEFHTCALLDNGEVKCWGRNNYGQLGQGNTASRGDQPGEMGAALAPVDLGNVGSAVAIAVGGNQSCAQMLDGSWKCWGYNSYGQLGLGDTGNRGTSGSHMGDNLPRLDFGTGRTALELHMEENHACALLDDNTIKCWGRDHAGQLGYEQNAARGDQPDELGDALPTVQVGSTPVASLARGNEHQCVLFEGGTTACWGRNDWGQLGLGDTDARGDDSGELAGLRGIDLGTGRSVLQVAAGSQHTCALLDGGAIKCWGYNGSGRLGLGDTSYRGNEPDEMGDFLPEVELGGPAVAVAAGGTGEQGTSCAVMADATLKCWGYNGDGRLGQGHGVSIGADSADMGDNLPPIDLVGQVSQVEIGGDHICAVLTDGALKCWGDNEYGQLGLGDDNNRGDSSGDMGDDLPAVDLGAGNRVSAVALGIYHTCALQEDGAVKCWGRNQYGQLGRGDRNARGDDDGEMGAALPPVDLGSGRYAIALSAWSNHTCAVLDNSTIKCWGANNYGELGQGDRNHRGDQPGEMGDQLAPIVLP